MTLQCCQVAGLFLPLQKCSATGLLLCLCTQDTGLDWNPVPQPTLQGLQGPGRQYTSHPSEEQFLLAGGLCRGINGTEVFAFVLNPYSHNNRTEQPPHPCSQHSQLDQDPQDCLCGLNISKDGDATTFWVTCSIFFLYLSCIPFI